MKQFLFFLLLLFVAGLGHAQNNSSRVCDANAAYTSWNNCLGTVTLANGNRYDGRFESGMPNGQGSALFTKGYRYIGQFKNGEYNGLGILVDRNMKVLQSGLWTDGKFVEDQTVDAPPLIASVKQHMPTATQSMGADKPKPNEAVETVAALPTVSPRAAVSPRPAPPAPELSRKPTETVQADMPQKPRSTARGNKLALVIGNDSYVNVGKLKNAREDARTMAENLQGLNYKVTLKLDVTQKEMVGAIRNFATSVQGGDEVVIFYAGHGVQIQGTNYLLPIDLAVENESQVKDDAVPLQRILDDMAASKARLTLAIIDACRNNPLPQGNGRALGGRGLATTNPASGQMIIFSAGSGQEALDKLGKNDNSKNGLFTRIFVNEMKKPGLTVDRILRNVRIEVDAQAKSVNHVQTPSIYDEVVGDFYFNE